MHPRKKTIKELEKNGFIFKRHGASHDLYFQPNTKQTIVRVNVKVSIVYC